MIFKVHCVGCGDVVDKKNATKVPQNETRREEWAEIFGKHFFTNCLLYHCPYVCISHFKHNKRSKYSLPIRRPNRNPDITELDHWFWSTDEQHDSDSNALEESIDEVSFESEEYIDPDDDDDIEIDGDEDVEMASESTQNYKYIFCETANVMKLLRKCKRCGNKETRIQIQYLGLGVNVSVNCVECDRSWKWNNSNKCDSEEEERNSKLTQLHLDMTASIFLSGNGFQNIKGMFGVLESPFFSSRTYNRLKAAYLYPAVGVKYNEMMGIVNSVMSESIKDGELLHILGDGSFDSRGHSALFCRYIFMESSSKLVVNYEIMHRKANEKRFDMEKMACENGLNELVEEFTDERGDLKLASFTTDRSKSVTQMMKSTFSSIDHFYDSWHYIRGLALEVLSKSKQKKFEPMAVWCKRFLNHIYWCISESQGDGELAKERLLSFFCHVLDMHKNFENCAFYQFKRVFECQHQDLSVSEEKDFLSLDDEKHVKALNILLSLIQKGNKLDAIKKVSPFYATSSVESFNSRAVFYATKDRFFSEDGFKVRTQISIIDWNKKQLDEKNGERFVVGEKKFFNKTTKQFATKYVKSAANYDWRNDIAKIASRIRCEESSSLRQEEEEVDSNSDNEDEYFTDDYSEKRRDADKLYDELWDRFEICSDDDDSLTEEEKEWLTVAQRKL